MIRNHEAVGAMIDKHASLQEKNRFLTNVHPPEKHHYTLDKISDKSLITFRPNTQYEYVYLMFSRQSATVWVQGIMSNVTNINYGIPSRTLWVRPPGTWPKRPRVSTLQVLAWTYVRRHFDHSASWQRRVYKKKIMRCTHVGVGYAAGLKTSVVHIHLSAKLHHDEIRERNKHQD